MRVIHGHSYRNRTTRTYSSWANMMTRCYNSKVNNYQNYGGRGIVVCERWHTFANFLEDMGERPEGTTLDRKLVDGNYEKSNCQWSDKSTQANNQRSNILLEWDGKSMTMAEWSRQIGMPYCTLKRRIQRGWSVERALTEPLSNGKEPNGTQALSK